MRPIKYAALLRRVWPLLIACTLLGALAGFGIAKLTPKEYTATSRSFVSTRTGATASDLVQSNDFSQGRVKSYADVVTSRVVLQPVAARLRVSGGVEELTRKVTSMVPVDTVLVNIAVVDHSPRRAAELANAVTKQFQSVVSTLEISERPGGESPVRISNVEAAVPPSSPSAPNLKLYVALAAAIGALLAWVAAVAREALSTRLRSAEQLGELIPVPVLAELTSVGEKTAVTRPGDGHPAGHHAEAYRQLRTNLEFSRIDSPARSIVVTSAIQGEGKSTVAANLAAALAESGRTVVLVDGDMRRPSISAYLGVEAAPGLAGVLTAQTDLSTALQAWGDSTLRVLTAGAAPPNPSELLDSRAMSELIARLMADFEYVIIDAPPVMPVADPLILAAKADGVLFVSRQGLVRVNDVVTAAERLSAVGADVLGVVVNDTPRPRGAAGYGYGYGYSSPDPATPSPSE